MLAQLGLVVAMLSAQATIFEDVVARCQDEHARRIAEAESRIAAAGKKLAQLKKGHVSRRASSALVSQDGHLLFPNQAAKRRAVEKQETKLTELALELGELKESKQLPFPTLPSDLSVGSVGRAFDAMTISQIIDESNMLMKGRIGSTVKQDQWGRSVAVGPVQLIWVRGIDTRGMADGGKAVYSKPFVVTGTTRYETVIGASKTVYVLEPFDLEQARQSLPAGFSFEYDMATMSNQVLEEVTRALRRDGVPAADSDGGKGKATNSVDGLHGQQVMSRQFDKIYVVATPLLEVGEGFSLTISVAFVTDPGDPARGLLIGVMMLDDLEQHGRLRPLTSLVLRVNGTDRTYVGGDRVKPNERLDYAMLDPYELLEDLKDVERLEVTVGTSLPKKMQGDQVKLIQAFLREVRASAARLGFSLHRRRRP